jgi:hypothetical protein
MAQVTGYYDLSDLVNDLGLQPSEKPQAREIIKRVFSALASATAQSHQDPHKPNLVVLDDIGSFCIESIQGRSYVIRGKVVTKPHRLKVEFYPAEVFRQIVKENLPEDIKHLEVL